MSWYKIARFSIDLKVYVDLELCLRIHFLTLLFNEISMNAATVAMIATKMQLVQIPLDALIAVVTQDLQEMGANVMV